MRPKKVFVPTVVCLVLCAIFLVLESVWQYSGPVVRLDGKLSSVQHALISVNLDITKLFINLSIAIMGGVGFFLKEYVARNLRATPSIWVTGGVSTVLSVTSIYFGHMVFNNVIVMLGAGSFPELMSTFGVLQYVSFIMSIVFAVLCISTVLSVRKETANEND